MPVCILCVCVCVSVSGVSASVSVFVSVSVVCLCLCFFLWCLHVFVMPICAIVFRVIGRDRLIATACPQHCLNPSNDLGREVAIPVLLAHSRNLLLHDMNVVLYLCVCACVRVYMPAHLSTHTHTHMLALTHAHARTHTYCILLTSWLSGYVYVTMLCM